MRIQQKQQLQVLGRLRSLNDFCGRLFSSKYKNLAVEPELKEILLLIDQYDSGTRSDDIAIFNEIKDIIKEIIFE